MPELPPAALHDAVPEWSRRWAAGILPFFLLRLDRGTMRLLIDMVTVASPGGQALLLELPASLAEQCPPGWEVVFLTADDGNPPAESTGYRTVTFPPRRGYLGMWRWWNRELPGHIRDLKGDVVYSTPGILSRRVVRSAGTVNLINNMLPFTSHLIRHYRPLSREWIRLMLLQRVFTSSCRMSDAVVSHSHHGMRMVHQFAGDISEKSFVAVNPMPSFVRYDPAHPPTHPYDGKPFLFYLSVVFYYKNHLNLIEAYRRAMTRGQELPDLLIAGPPTDRDYVAKMERAIREGGFGGKIRYLGKIPQEDIPRYLHHATINVFPSTCETSSYVQAEILGAHGVMACSDTDPMPEVSGGAAELFDPLDPDSIAEVMVRLSNDENRRAELRLKAAEVAAGMSREACAEVTWKAVLHAHQAFRRRQAG